MGRDATGGIRLEAGEQAGAVDLPADARTAVFVEGASDSAAVESFAQISNVDLAALGVAVVPMGGVTNIGRFLDEFGPSGLGLRLAGLCDEPEVRFIERGLERAGLGVDLDRDGLARLGFFVCVRDLEDELIRALGVPAIEEILLRAGDLGSFRTFQNQPFQRLRPAVAQVRRFLGAGARRKIRYGSLLVRALPVDAAPEPLHRLISYLAD